MPSRLGPSGSCQGVLIATAPSDWIGQPEALPGIMSGMSVASGRTTKTGATGDGEETSWILDVVVRDKCIKVTCGDATQRVRWLGHVGIARYDEKNYQGWKILGVPTKITNREGLPIDMGGLISDVLKDGDTVYVSHSLEPHDVERQD